MSSKQFSQEQKLAIVKNAATIGFKEAAEIAEVHYTTVYDWQRKLDSLGKEAFLAYQPSYPGRGIKVISPEKEAAVLDCWETNLGFGPGQVRGQLRRQGMTVSIRSVRKIMKANGYAATGKKSDKVKPHRFEARRPLELARMDILEFFINKAKVYFACMSPEIKALIDRACMVSIANEAMLRRKVGAAVVAVRRAGAVNTFDSINHFFTIGQMIIPGSRYWNMGFGREKGEVNDDAEGLDIMKTLGENMAWLLKKIAE